ncbi:MAG: hypothetical protein ABJA37_00105 [Ferruginibacter sp.]
MQIVPHPDFKKPALPYFIYGTVFQYYRVMPNTVYPLQKNISSQVILSTIVVNKDLRGWQLFYDKYAAAMFGCICSLTSDNQIAEQILLDAIMQLKEKEILQTFSYAFLPSLLKYTNDFTIQQLLQQGMEPKTEDTFQKARLTYLICSRCYSLKEAAAILNISEEETKKKLHLEFLDMREETARFTK